MPALDCPHCGEVIDVPDREGTCPHCGRGVGLPDPSHAAAESPAATPEAAAAPPPPARMAAVDLGLAGIALVFSVLALVFSGGDPGFRPVLSNSAPAAGPVTVGIDADNSITTSGRPVPAAELPHLVGQRQNRQPVTIAADPDALFDTVMLAARALYAGGARQIIITIRND